LRAGPAIDQFGGRRRGRSRRPSAGSRTGTAALTTRSWALP